MSRYLIEPTTENIMLQGKKTAINFFTVVLLNESGERIKGIRKYFDLGDAERRMGKLSEKIRVKNERQNEQADTKNSYQGDQKLFGNTCYGYLSGKVHYSFGLCYEDSFQT
jgi:hypothetical protein